MVAAAPRAHVSLACLLFTAGHFVAAPWPYPSLSRACPPVAPCLALIQRHTVQAAAARPTAEVARAYRVLGGARREGGVGARCG